MLGWSIGLDPENLRQLSFVGLQIYLRHCNIRFNLTSMLRSNVVKMSAPRYSSCAVVVDNVLVVTGGTTMLSTGQSADLVGWSYTHFHLYLATYHFAKASRTSKLRLFFSKSLTSWWVPIISNPQKARILLQSMKSFLNWSILALARKLIIRDWTSLVQSSLVFVSPSLH